MKKGITSNCLMAKSYDEMFATAKSYGFDGVELTMYLESAFELTPQTTYEEAMEIKKAAQKHDIELYSISGAGFVWKVSLTSDDKEVREKAMFSAKRLLEVAKWLECETVLLVPGHAGVDFAPALGVVDYEVAYNRALDAVKELAVYAEEQGVVLGIENVWNKFLISPLEMRDFIDEVGSDYVKSYFDVGNVVQTSYPEHWIKVLNNRIAKVHLKDFKRSLNSFCDLLAGDVDYKAVAEELKKIGYDGWVTAEMGIYPNANSVMLKHTIDAMKFIFD